MSAVNGVLGTDIPLPGLPLPIGISFYTFQTMSYTIDVYRGQARVQKNIISFGAYVSLFPQLIAGPIVRYSTIAESLDNRTVTPDAFGEGAKRFCIGLGKKVLIANNVGMIWDSVSGGDIQTLPVFTAWLGIIAFALQIYFDFSGYSDMAIGLGKMFGFDFLENFNYPYMSESVTEFWRRWHISLGTWFREYVYIPLGGSRCSKAKNFRNIAIVWLLTGLWHGASWNFLLWGAWFGVLLIAEKCFLLKLLDRAPSAVAHIYTLLAVLFSWVIFSFDKVSEIAAFFRAMLGLNGCGFADTDGLYLFLTNSVLLAVAVVACTNLPKRLAEKLSERAGTHQVLLQSGRAAVCAALLLLSTSYLVDSVYNPFLYFRF